MFAFTLILSIVLLIQPILMIYLGKYYKNNIPKTINKTIGYRTRMSMMNHDTWQFAHNYWGSAIEKIGRYLLIISVIPFLVYFMIWKSDFGQLEVIGGVVIMLIVVEIAAYFFAIYLTEKAIKQNFDNAGLRK